MIIKNDKTYDVLAIIGRIVLPGLVVLVASLGDIWGFEYADQISRTIAAIVVFLNAFLEKSSTNYYKDQIDEMKSIGQVSKG